MEKRRTGGMTAIAVLNVIVGGLVILTGLFRLFGSGVLIYELTKFNVFDMGALLHSVLPRLAFALLVLAAGVAGLIAGIGMFALHPWSRTLSLLCGVLLILSAAFSYLIVPIIATIGTYNVTAIDSAGLVRLIVTSTIYVVLPVAYAIVLFVVFHRPAWRSTFARVRMA
jgi:hypothetical protein